MDIFWFLLRGGPFFRRLYLLVDIFWLVVVNGGG